MKRKFIFIIALILIILFNLAGCRKERDLPTISFEKTNITLTVGQDATILAEIGNTTEDLELLYVSSNESIVVVNKDLITAVGTGNAKITVSLKEYPNIKVVINVQVNDKVVPLVSNPKESYLTATEGEFEYTITNEVMYQTLKFRYGLDCILAIIDEDLMKITKKNQISFWDLVTDVEINEKFEYDVFLNKNKDVLSEEEIEQEKAKYLEKLFFNYSLSDVYDYYRLLLAKSKYTEDQLNNYSIEYEMMILRDRHGIKFYDKDLEKDYINKTKQYNLNHNTSIDTSADMVAKTEIKTYSADELFERMSFNYGMNVSSDKLIYLKLLYNTTYNKIYNIETKSILDATKWEALKQEVIDMKNNFELDVYVEFGYPKTMGWERFLKKVYGVNNSEELLYYFLYQKIKKDYIFSLGDLTNASDDDEVWKLYEQKMNEIADDFFKVEGVHLLITINNSLRQPTNPTNWTNLQVQYAKDLYQEIMAYLQVENGDTYIEKLRDIKDAFSNAPIGDNNYMFNNIDISKYKSAGFGVIYEDLGTIVNKTMVAPFNEALRSIWKENPTSTTPTIYGMTPDDEGNWTYLQTKYGYHIYINMKSYDIEKWDEATNQIIPTLEQIKCFLEDETTDKINDKVRRAIYTYYKPIFAELTGDYNFMASSYRSILELNIILGHQDFTLENFQNYIDLKVKDYS